MYSAMTGIIVNAMPETKPNTKLKQKEYAA